MVPRWGARPEGHGLSMPRNLAEGDNAVIIEADREETWPQQMLAELAANADQIAAYHLERARIDRAAEGDVMLRVDRPPNNNEPIWRDILQMSERAIAKQRLLGFHATRLADSERVDIISNGLRVLSPELFERRMSAVEKAGLISRELGARLRVRNQVRDDNRSGRTAFCFTRRLLADEGGIGRLFRSWGGEAVYNSHEGDEQTGPAIAVIGQPCVVIAAVPVEAIGTYMSVAERLVNVWCAKRGMKPEHAPDFGGYVRADIPGGCIQRIVVIDDPEFLTLATHNTWRYPLR